MAADPKQNAKRGRPRLIGGSPALKKNRQDYDKCRNASKISIGSAKHDWDILRVELGLDSNETLAIRLIDSFKKMRTVTSTPSVCNKPILRNELVFDGTSVSSMSNHSAEVFELSQDYETDQPGHYDMELKKYSKSPGQFQMDAHHLQSLDLDNSIISVEVPYTVEDDEDPSWYPEEVEFSIRQEEQPDGDFNLPTINAADTVFGTEDDDYESDDEDVEEPCHPGAWQSVQKVDVTASSALCFFDNLITLAKITPPTRCKHNDCSSPVQMLLQEAGTAVHILWKCGQGHESLRWSSQPVLKRGLLLGNIMFCAAVVFSGNNHTKIEMLCRQLNLGVPSKHTFHRLQGKYIAPCIVRHWERTQTDILTNLQGKEVVIAGDGRNDSPGHCAQYCTYTVMDVHTSTILDMVIVDKRQTGNKSTTMEERGFSIALDKLIHAGVKVVEVVTDAHPQITSTMTQEKGCKDLFPWVGHITNHFWYCARNCEGNVATLLNKWNSTLHHTVGEHEWKLGRCDHNDLSDEHPPYLSPDSDAHRRLREVVYNPYLLRTLPYYVNFRSNSSLEVLNNHILMYASKRFSYRYPAFRARNLLAAIDYNYHKDRPERRNKEGDIVYKKSFSKYSNHFKVWPDKVDKDYRYLKDLMMDVVTTTTETGNSVRGPTSLLDEDPVRICKTLAPVPVPKTEDLVRLQQSRFSKFNANK